MKMVKYYLLVSLILLGLGWYFANLVLTPVLLWGGMSMMAVSCAYVFDKPSIFRKRENGKIPRYIRWLFMPFLAGASAYNWFARRYDSVPPVQQVTDDVYLACRLFPADIPTLTSNGVTAILDVTAEFDGLDWSSTDANLAYLNIPVLDHKSPNESQLQNAVSWIQQQIDGGGKVVIHCALGRGRSVFVTAAYLLASNPSMTVEAAIERVQSARQTARLNKRQLKALKYIREKGSLIMQKRIGIIANPVSGGGKWATEKAYIIERLERKYELIIEETTEDVSATELARRLLAQKCHMLVACGGDGTVAEVAEVVANTDCILGIIPLGTANALSMVLYGSHSKLMPISSACDALLEHHTCEIDTAVCNGQRTLLVCGIGVEAEMIKRSDRAEKDDKGQMAYLQFFADSMMNTQPMSLSVTLDDHGPHTFEIQSLVIANAAPPSTVLAQGGGNPDLFDGLLDVSWFEKQDNIIEKLTSLFGLTMSGLLDGKHCEGVDYKRAAKVVIEADEPIDYVLDGEVYRDKKITMSVEPKSLQVICASDFAQASQ